MSREGEPTSRTGRTDLDEIPGGDQLWEYCRGRFAHYKIPRYLRISDEFPLTVTGKVQQYRMRESSIGELGLAEAARTSTV